MILAGRGARLSIPTIGLQNEAGSAQDWYPVIWWERQGVAFSPTQPAEQSNVEEPHVFYEGNPQILTGNANVFKMWYGVGGFGNPVDFCYAESVDGLSWTKYAGNPLLEDFRRACVIKNAGTYYIFGADVNITYDHYDLYTSTTGVNPVLNTSAVLSVGSAGQWDDNQLGNAFVWVEGSTWYMLYDANQSGGSWKVGLATATDPAGPWTKSSSNPVVSATGTRGGSHLYKAPDGTYYLWIQYSVPTFTPTEIGLWYSKNLTHWLPFAVPYWYRETSDEGVGSANGQVADTSIVQANGKSYFYLGGHASQAANGVMKVQTMTGREPDIVNMSCPTLLSAVTIDSAQPTTNLNGIDLHVGEASDAVSTRRTVIKFDLSTVPVARVWAVRLRLYCDFDFSTNARDFKIYRLLQSYVANQVTWNNRDTSNAWQTAGASGASDADTTVLATRNFTAAETLNAWKEWDIDPSIIEAMVDGTYTNHGFLIKADTESSDAYRFTNGASDYKPQLILLLDQAIDLPLDGDAKTLIAAMTTEPDLARKELISHTVQRLKDEGIWSKLDEIWFFAAHAEQAGLLGWKRYKDATNVGSTPFTADRGFQRDTGTKYIQTNFNPSTNGVNFLQNNCSFGVYSRTDSDEGGVDIGCIQTTLTQIQASNASGNMAGAINITSGTVSGAVTNSLGLFVGRRTASNAQQIYRNGSQVTSNTSASTSRPNRALTVCARDNAGTIDAFTTRQYAAAFVGASLTATEQTTLYNIVQSYMASVGAQV